MTIPVIKRVRSLTRESKGASKYMLSASVICPKDIQALVCERPSSFICKGA